MNMSENKNFDIDPADSSKQNASSIQQRDGVGANPDGIGECHRKPILVLVNPHSGRGQSIKIYRSKISPFLEANHIEHDVFISRTDYRVFKYLQHLTISQLSKYKSILVVSGDGLLHEAVNALMTRPDWRQAIDIPIGIVPTGSGNGLAYTLIYKSRPKIKNQDEAIELCCEQAIQDETTHSDLVEISYGKDSTVWSFLSIGWGLLADIDIDSEWLRSLGEWRFTIYGLLRSITSVSYRGRLSYRVCQLSSDAETIRTLANESNSDEKMYDHDDPSNNRLADMTEDDDNWIHIEDSFACLYVVHQSHVSRVTNFSPKSTLIDELMYLTYIRGKLSIRQVIEFLLAIEDGSHRRLPYVRVVPVTRFRLQPLEASKIVVDGEVIPWTPTDGSIIANIAHKALKLSWCQDKS